MKGYFCKRCGAKVRPTYGRLTGVRPEYALYFKEWVDAEDGSRHRCWPEGDLWAEYYRDLLITGGDPEMEAAMRVDC